LTPICFAIQEGYLNIVKILAAAGADVNLPCDCMTPAQWAAASGQVGIL